MIARPSSLLHRMASRGAAALARWRLPCSLCGAPAPPGEVCADCLDAARLSEDRSCRRCAALVFTESLEAEPICAACRSHPPAFDRAWALMRYEPPWDGLVLQLKSGRFHHARWMAREMLGRLPQPCAMHTLLVPVPSRESSRLRRAANPAAVLARACARYSGARLAIGAIRRKEERAPSQHSLSRAQRESAVIQAFVAQPLVQGRSLLLIDDVMTTGSTLDAMARAAQAAGAAKVDALVLARTL